MMTWPAPKLADVLEVDAKSLRGRLRRTFREHEKGDDWILSREMVQTVCEQFVESGVVTREKAADAMATFDREAGGVTSMSPADLLGPIETAPPEGVATVGDESAVRAVAREILERRGAVSLFGDVESMTVENTNVLMERFVGQPNFSGGRFFPKLATQLSGVDDGVILQFAEIFLLQMLPLSGILPSTKVENIQKVLNLAEGTYEIPKRVIEAFEHPVFGGGRAFTSHRYEQLCMLIRLVEHMQGLTPDQLHRIFSDPLAWRDTVDLFDSSGGATIRHSVKYLAHPDYFFPIVSPDHRRKIVSSFYPEHTGRPASGDDDLDLYSMRQWIGLGDGVTPEFYESPLKQIWDPEEEADPEDVEPEATAAGTHAESYNISSIQQEGSFHDEEFLRSIVDRWGSVRNIVLQGPPGTGKTWLAKRLAYALIGRRERELVRSVQFHPGTSYEDFVRGWRPGSDGKLTLVDGPLLQHASRARAHPELPHVLVIEEFNRGNPAHALGEMLTLLESSKRRSDEALELTYMRDQEPPVFLPKNLYIVGTMNTADRSLALVDFALRRRFAFFTLEPQFNDAWMAHVVKTFALSEEGYRGYPVLEEIRRRVGQVNEQISADRGLGSTFRIGHSFFTPEQAYDISVEEWFSVEVKTSVAPLLAEYWPDSPDRADAAIGSLLEGE